MGGRGRRSGYSRYVSLRPLPPPRTWGYAAQQREEMRGGQSYPFLDQLGQRQWTVVTYPNREGARPIIHDAHSFGMERPTLRWSGGSTVNEIYVDGMDTDTFLRTLGLDVNMRKGGFVYAKRISRVLRPYDMATRFDAGDVRVGYMEQDETAKKVWDGAGLISRRMLERMQLSTGMAPAKRQRLVEELAHTHRVEFTILTAKGEDKGHAIVAERLHDAAGNEVDFLLPEDTKGEVLMRSGTFVGIKGVHHRDEMRLDVQSLVNLHPFFDEEQLTHYMQQESELFLHAMETGEVGAAMRRLGRGTTTAELDRDLRREFFASGGDVRWFAPIMSMFGNQHLKRLSSELEDKYRFPIPGGRYYVMPAAVGRAAGKLDVAVERGQIHMDPATSSAWVNDEDWVQLPESKAGLAGIWGGADNDDALWCHRFTDHDGAEKILAWRSPNQAGEYVILAPTATSHVSEWETTEGTITAPAGDSRRLPPRIDTMAVDYLITALPEPEGYGGLVRSDHYHDAAIESAIQRGQANRGATGQHTNYTMVTKFLTGGLDPAPVAPLDLTIDSEVKTGDDTTPIKRELAARGNAIRLRGVRLPGMLRGRVPFDPDSRPSDFIPPVLRDKGENWINPLEASRDAHIVTTRGRIEALVRDTNPPRQLYRATYADGARTMVVARHFNALYATTVKRLQKGRWKGQPPLDKKATILARAEMLPLSIEARDEQLAYNFFVDEWFKLSSRRDGDVHPREREGAIQRAQARLSRMSRATRDQALERDLVRRHADRLQREGYGTSRLDEAGLDELRQTMEAFLADYRPDRQRAILRCALISAEGDKEKRQARAAFLLGEKDAAGRVTPGISRTMLDALREVGVLDELDNVTLGGKSRLMAYPNAMVRPVAGQGRKPFIVVYDQEAIEQRRHQGKKPSAAARVDESHLDRTDAFFRGEAELRLEGERLWVYMGEQRIGMVDRNHTDGLEAGMRLRTAGALSGGDRFSVEIEEIVPPSTGE